MDEDGLAVCDLPALHIRYLKAVQKLNGCHDALELSKALGIPIKTRPKRGTPRLPRHPARTRLPCQQ